MHTLVFFFSALCSLSTSSYAETSKSLSGFSIDLIHRDSPLSPFYNSSLTQSELIRNAALRSISRSNRFSLSLNKKNELSESIIIPIGGDYLMRIYIGTPPVERFAIADTGSDLIWVQCTPCDSKNCFHQDAPLFDPNKSSTFMAVKCDSKPCNLLPRGLHICGNSSECKYLYAYSDMSYTIGDLGIDSINFGSPGGGQAVKFPKSIFGCGYKNHFTFPPKTTGLVGLGAGPLSLVSQLGETIGHKFSYCLPFSLNSTSKLKFGKEATISRNGVVSTPLIIQPSLPFYFINLEGITVGQKKLKTDKTDGNIFIDSGTTLTYLEPSFYNDFVTSVKEAIGVEAIQNPPDPFKFCFAYQANMNIPDFVFHFTSADITLKPKNMFIGIDNNLVCLAIVPTNLKVAVFGNIAQIDFQVEYDLKGKKVSFAPTDCAKN